MPVAIHLPQKYLSIGKLTCPELPDFAVIIGRNGAGKTQFLKAIHDGHARVRGTPSGAIEFYDIATFSPRGGRHSARNSSELARTTAREYIHGNREPSPISLASDLFEQHAAEIQKQEGTQARDQFVTRLHERIHSTPDFGVFPTGSREGNAYERALHATVIGPLAQRSLPHADTSGGPSFNGSPAAVVTMAMKLAGKLPHELSYDDIMRAAHYEGGTIENSISEVFAAYKIDQYDWAHARFEDTASPVNYRDLLAEYQQGNPPPWQTLRDVLASMREAAGEDGLFDFDFSDPADLRLDMTNRQTFTFAADMINRTSGARYGFETLSSGEKILMALCLASFNQRLGRRRPGLVLIDELDAILHPSMVVALVAALRSLFVDHGCPVVMTTHSPMTVAALAETSVFRVIRAGEHVRVVPTTTFEAIEELSEGIATLDTGLRIATSHEADVTILTEGHNALHLKRWVELNFPGRVHVFDRLAKHTDKGQLRSYGRLLAAMGPDSHFVVVWDCDAAPQAQMLRDELPAHAKVTPFAFEKRQNEIARSGIENNYEEAVLLPYAITKSDSDGRKLGREFNKSRKSEFASHVWQNGTPDYFVHFEQLQTLVAGILESQSGPEGRSE